MLSCMRECRENRLSESHTFLRVEVNFCRTFGNSLQILAEICKEDAHVMLLSTCKFHENRYSEGHTFPKDVTDIVTLFPTFFFRLG